MYGEIPFYKEKVQAIMSKYHLSPRVSEAVVLRFHDWVLEDIANFFTYANNRVVHNMMRRAMLESGFKDQIHMTIDMVRYLDSINFSELS